MNTNIQSNDGFTPIQQPPPISNKPILVKLFDKWRGKGRETEIVTVTYDGTIYKTFGDKQIPKRFITGWRENDI